MKATREITAKTGSWLPNSEQVDMQEGFIPASFWGGRGRGLEEVGILCHWLVCVKVYDM